ncbi:purine-nucleoside phosphorylase [Desulfurobacterium pacificum]|uniref:purine-nucleoside phosphorylase n=1 Tax=Desulfurobacterium pacificum TaxID=240166 RepID=A0ABY1NTS0_9BACT|nr:purine-nucleoside phosphorylase [Desulfurobacterium pacificum]SMP17769.1 purine-nucleoside phosphorylase [Desulfurobacterium pacificum]
MKAADFIREQTGIETFDVAIVGGSGISLGNSATEIPYSLIPGMPEPYVPGHSGVLKVLTIGTKPVLFFEGRFHYYEGRTDAEILFIPYLCKKLGVKIFIPTCSSGAVSRKAANCDVGIITDHINLMGRNPLTGLIKNYGAKVFVNGKEFYSERLAKAFLETSLKLGIKAEKVTLAAVLGPNYETFAEIRMLEVLGADCVSMSTVPEVIAANFLGIETIALTVPVNDTLKLKTNHEEVVKVAERKSSLLSELIVEALSNF